MSEKSGDQIGAKPTYVDVYFLAMTIALGGQYNRWNAPLADGFWLTFFLVVLNGIGYVCFAACMAEMAGTLPFSGGIYGFVRAFLGPLSGYIVSRYEMIMVICYVASLVQSIGTFPTLAGISSNVVEPAWWLLFYVISTAIALLGCDYRVYWAFIRVIGFLSLVLMVVYILGSFNSVNYDRYAGEETFRMSDIAKSFETAGMFRGLQFLPLVSIKLADAKRDIPRGMFFAMVTLFMTAIGVVFTTCTQYPGTTALAGSFLPMTTGFATIFNLSTKQAMWLSFPALFGNFYGFVWAYGRQLSSIAKSGLLPEMIGWMTESTDTPYVALIVGLFLSFGLALISYYDVFYISFKEDVRDMYRLSSYIIYMFFFVSYIIFKEKYSSLERTFSSPLGEVGAYIGLVVFGVNVIGFLSTAGASNIPLYVLIVAAIIMVVYFQYFLAANQQFSQEEKDQMFKAYLINANAKSRQLMKKRQKAAMIAPSSKKSNKNSSMKSELNDGESLASSSKVVSTPDWAASVVLPPLKNNQVSPAFPTIPTSLKEDAVQPGELVAADDDDDLERGM